MHMFGEKGNRAFKVPSIRRFVQDGITNGHRGDGAKEHRGERRRRLMITIREV
jgi:hypothetical protein